MTPTNILLALTILAFGLWAGRVVAQKAEAKKPITGGPIAKGAHYLAASIATVLPLTLCSTLFLMQLGRWQALGICVGLFALQFLLLGITALSARSSAGASKTA
jgi:hypothetical protein